MKTALWLSHDCEGVGGGELLKGPFLVWVGEGESNPLQKKKKRNQEFRRVKIRKECLCGRGRRVTKGGVEGGSRPSCRPDMEGAV